MTLTTPIDMLRSAVAGNAYAALRAFVDAHDLGYVFPAGLYYALWKASPQVKNAQQPDASFVLKHRLPRAIDLALPFPGAPDLAVEVVTVTETGIVSVEKARDYLAAGTPEVWVMYTSLKELHQYRRDDPGVIRVFRAEDVIEPLPLPGMRVSAASLFAFP